MKNIIPIFIVLLVAFFSMEAKAQSKFLDKVAKKVEKKAEQRLDRKVDKKIDQGLDKTEEGIDNSVQKGDAKEPIDPSDGAEPNRREAGNTGFLGMTNVTIGDTYSFDQKIDYHITIVSEKEKNEMDIEVAVPTNRSDPYSYFRVISADNVNDTETTAGMFMIMDAGNDAMVTVMPAQKQYMAMSFDRASIDTQMEEQGEVDFKKTGKTKNILGFKCEEYSIDTEESSGSMWMSDDPALEGANPFGGMAQSMKNTNVNFNDLHMKGAMLEMNMIMKNVEKKKDVQTVDYLATSIDKQKMIIDMSKYKNMMQFQN